MNRILTLLALVLLVSLAGGVESSARAQGASDARPSLRNAYALVVGSDRGGEGQSPLRYAELDASRMRDALVEVGGYVPEHVTLLRSPSVSDVNDALTDIRRRIDAHRRRGDPTQLVFYYSGHARSNSLNLDQEELRLERLRELLEGMGADLTFVLLDACQSGAYSRVRGAEPAADFSYNSVEQLRMGGLVVLASSSGDELSQESESLRGGFFTHHLVVGLRGAADSDGDGRVTVDEVYSYAYANTLADTSRTAVGGQHVTMEMELVGHGAVPLSYPEQADAHMVIGPSVSGTLLVQRARSGAVVAEVEKARGDRLRLALPAGRYLVLVRGESSLHECSITLRRGAEIPVVLDRCDELDPARDARSRGAMDPAAPARWGIEATAGTLFGFEGAYDERLEAFGFTADYAGGRSPRFGLALERPLGHRISLVGRAATLSHFDYSRDNGADAMGTPLEDDRFVGHSFGFGLGARATGLFAGGKLGVYGEFGAGFGLARTRLELAQGTETSEIHYGYYLNATAGLRYMPARRFGFLLEVGYTYAPIVDNLLGDVRDSGGIQLVGGIRGEVRRGR